MTFSGIGVDGLALEVGDLAFHGAEIGFQFFDLAAQELRRLGRPTGAVAGVFGQDQGHQLIGHAARKLWNFVFKAHRERDGEIVAPACLIELEWLNARAREHQVHEFGARQRLPLLGKQLELVDDP